MKNILECYAEVPAAALEAGYEMKTTFWGDFRVCQHDQKAVKDTYKRAFAGYNDDKIMGTELSLVLNWLGWYYHGNEEDKDLELSTLYFELWGELDAYILDHWKGDDIEYYIRNRD